ncbi:hypothetical protein PATA110616_22850 [Paenibacillus tarimensis]
MHHAVDIQHKAAGLPVAGRASAGIRRYADLVLVDIIVELAEVVKVNFRLCAPNKAILRFGEIAAYAVPKPLVRNAAQAFLDLFNLISQIPAFFRLQDDRKLGRKPADCSRDVDIRSDRLASVSFEIDPHPFVSRPLANGYAERRYQNIVHFGVVGPVNPLQQQLRFFGSQTYEQRFAVLLRRNVRLHILRQGRHLNLFHGLPIGPFLRHLRALCVSGQLLGPSAVRIRFRRETNFPVFAGLLVTQSEILHQNTPRNAVHHGMMNREQQMIAVLASEQSRLHEGPVLQIDARLNVRCLRFHSLRGILRSVLEVEHVQREQPAFLNRAVPRAKPLLRLAEHHPQGVMMLGQLLQHLMDRLFVEAFLPVQHHRLVEMMRVRKGALEKPMLNRRQRRFTRYFALIDGTTDRFHMQTEL